MPAISTILCFTNTSGNSLSGTRILKGYDELGVDRLKKKAPGPKPGRHA